MLTLKDKLSRLTFRQGSKLLGLQGDALIRQGGGWEIEPEGNLIFNENKFLLNLDDGRVSIKLDDSSPRKLRIKCSKCSGPCEHQGAAISFILEEKMLLGLAEPPKERAPAEVLSEEALTAQAIADREERARTERFRVKADAPGKLWTDYEVFSRLSGRRYKVALRGWEPGESYCSCPDFRKNTLGTCKHVIHVQTKVRKKFTPDQRAKGFKLKGIIVFLKYGHTHELRVEAGDKTQEGLNGELKPFLNKPVKNIAGLVAAVSQLINNGLGVTIYPDAEEYINRQLHIMRLKTKVDEIRRNPAKHPLREELLKTRLLPYQLDGIAFAVGRGRAVLADDMGLGKTIQGIGAAELFSRICGITKVLIICPTSLKSQWKVEIGRFSERDCRIVVGSAKERAAQYANECFFTICNYEQILRDANAVHHVPWDLIILDEAQRIKNWEAKTTRAVKALRSPYALVLTGTPMENRLEELYSVVEFVDDTRLGPAFRFINTYRMADEKGRVLGYKNLDLIRDKMKPLLLRRTRQNVMQDLPPRTTEVVRITPSQQQLEMHDGHKRVISSIINKKYFTEMDFLRLQKAMLMCRMIADSTYLADKLMPSYSTKLEELDNLLQRLNREDDRKIVLFSEWTTMLNLIEPILTKHKMSFVRLDGSVPQKKRQALVNRFQSDPACKLFITTNAGSTGLNLQAGNTVINVDLPWNPAILEQRISRVHRMGQKRPIQVYLLVTTETLEEGLLGTLSAKHELAKAALDIDSNITEVSLQSGIEELKRRLEVLLGQQPDAAEVLQDTAEMEKQKKERKERIAAAGGQLLTAAFMFMGEMMPQPRDSEKVGQMASAFKNTLEDCFETDEAGQVKMTVKFANMQVVEQLSQTLARLAVAGQG